MDKIDETVRSKILVGYPVEKPWDTEVVKEEKRQRLSKDWKFYPALTEYDTDCYEDAQFFYQRLDWR